MIPQILKAHGSSLILFVLPRINNFSDKVNNMLKDVSFWTFWLCVSGTQF